MNTKKLPSKADIYRWFLWDVFYDLKEDALETKRKIKKAKNKEDKIFEEGRRIAYWEVLKTIKFYLWSFKIHPKTVRFNINPDRDIMGLTSRPKLFYTREMDMKHEHKKSKKNEIKCSRCGHYLCKVCKEHGVIWCDTLLWSKNESGFVTKEELKKELPYICCGGQCVIKK